MRTKRAVAWFAMAVLLAAAMLQPAYAAAPVEGWKENGDGTSVSYTPLTLPTKGVV